MPIVKIHQGQPWLAVRLVTHGSGSQQLIDWQNLRLAILPPQCPRRSIPLSPQHFEGCWPTHDIEKFNNSFILPENRPTIIYPAFKTDERGAVIFRLDDLIWRHPGRYLGLIETNDGRPIVELDLDVDTTRFIIEDVVVAEQQCGA